MDVAVRLAVPVGLCRWRDSPTCYSPLVKVTYDLKPSGWASLSAEQEPITDGEIAGGIIIWPSDFGEAKGACEIAVVGAALREHQRPIRIRVGGTALEADRAHKLGPIGRGGGRSYFAIDAARTSFPNLPLEIVIEGVGETVRCALPLPAPDIALVMGKAWGEAQRIRPFIDQVLLDPIRRRCVLVFRGFFTYPGDLDSDGSLVVDARGLLDTTAPREIGRWPRMSAITLDDFADERTPIPAPADASDDAPTPDSDSRPSIPMMMATVDDGETTGEQVRHEATVDASLEATSELARSPVAAFLAHAASAEAFLDLDASEAEELLDDDSTSDPPVDDPSTTEAPQPVMTPAQLHAQRHFDRTIPMPARSLTPLLGVPAAREPARSAVPVRPARPTATTQMPVFGPPPTSPSTVRKPARTQQMTSADLDPPGTPPPMAAPPTFGRPPAPTLPDTTDVVATSPPLQASPPVSPGPTGPPPRTGGSRFKDENENTQLFVLPAKPAGQVSTGLPFAPAAPRARADAGPITPRPSAPLHRDRPQGAFAGDEGTGVVDLAAIRRGTAMPLGLPSSVETRSSPPTVPPPTHGSPAERAIPAPPETPSERRTAPPPPMPSQPGWRAATPPTEPPPGPSTEPPPPPNKGPSTAPPPPLPSPRGQADASSSGATNAAPPKRRMFDADEHTAQIQLPVAPRALPFVEGGARSDEERAQRSTGAAFPPTPVAGPAFADGEMRNEETLAVDEDRLTALPEPRSDGRGTIPPPAFAVTPGAPDWLSQPGGIGEQGPPRGAIQAPPSLAALLKDLGAPPPVEASTIAPTAWKPRVVEAPAQVALVSDSAPSISLEEYAALRAELWSGAKSRRDVLKSRGLSELRWRAIERKFAREIDSLSNDPARLLPLLSRMDAAAQ